MIYILTIPNLIIFLKYQCNIMWNKLNYLHIVTVILIVFYGFTSTAVGQKKQIRVAVYDDIGGGGRGSDNVELCLSNDTTFFTKRVSADEIRLGMLNSFDVVVQAGGSGSKQAKTLEESGVDSIRQFVKRGGGYLGICAGAYLSTVEYTWSLGILNANVIDREHWNRGGGIIRIRLTAAGREFFGMSDDTISLNYNQGPLLAQADKPDLPAYEELAVFETEIVENGAPEGIMIGLTAIAQGNFGEGRILAISPHPEKSPELRHMISTAVKWLARK
jgi:glutamine amidotransferase-like uncharacterized protein